jgi:hypothetical protein
MVGIGVRVPAAPPGRAGARGLSVCKTTHPTSTLCSSADFNAGAVGLRIASPRGDAMPGEVGRPVSGAVAHLGERLTGSQEVVGSIPTGSTVSSPFVHLLLRPRKRGPCLVNRRR